MGVDFEYLTKVGFAAQSYGADMPRSQDSPNVPTRLQRVILVRCVLITTVLWWPTVSAAYASAASVIENVNVVAMVDWGVVEGRDVLIENGKISRIVATGSVEWRGEISVVDGDGKYLLPGLIDAHTHLGERGALDGYLSYGVTTVRDMWGSPRYLSWRDAINQGQLRGPELIVATPFAWLGAPESVAHWEVDTVAQAKAVAQRAQAEGYDLVKIVQILDPEILSALVEEGRRLGIPVGGHFAADPETTPLSRYAASGVTSIEHLDELAGTFFADASEEEIREAARALADNDVYFTTLLKAIDFLCSAADGEKGPDSFMKSVVLWSHGAYQALRMESLFEFASSLPADDVRRVGYAIAPKVLRIFLQEDVQIALGTEGPQFYAPSGTIVHEEMAVLRQAGLTAHETLRTATVNGAAALGLIHRKGTLEVGKDADLILADRNPLADVSTLREPLAVFVRGTMLDRETLEFLRRID